MKFLLKSNLIITSIFLILFGLVNSTQAAQVANKNSKTKEESEKLWQSDSQREFFGSDIFAEMEAMEKHMNQAFEEHRRLMKKMFQDNKSAKKSSGNSLALYQDEKFYRYELNFSKSSFKKEDVVIAFDGSILNISANSEKSLVDKKKSENYSSNNFYYSLSIPKDAVGNPEIIRKDGEIVVKFAKGLK